MTTTQAATDALAFMFDKTANVGVAIVNGEAVDCAAEFLQEVARIFKEDGNPMLSFVQEAIAHPGVAVPVRAL